MEVWRREKKTRIEQPPPRVLTLLDSSIMLAPRIVQIRFGEEVAESSLSPLFSEQCNTQHTPFFVGFCGGNIVLLLSGALGGPSTTSPGKCRLDYEYICCALQRSPTSTGLTHCVISLQARQTERKSTIDLDELVST